MDNAGRPLLRRRRRRSKGSADASKSAPACKSQGKPSWAQDSTTFVLNAGDGDEDASDPDELFSLFKVDPEDRLHSLSTCYYSVSLAAWGQAGAEEGEDELSSHPRGPTVVEDALQPAAPIGLAVVAGAAASPGGSPPSLPPHALPSSVAADGSHLMQGAPDPKAEAAAAAALGGEGAEGGLTAGLADGASAQPPLLGLFQEVTTLGTLDIRGAQAEQEDQVRAAHKTVAALIADFSSGSPASSIPCALPLFTQAATQDPLGSLLTQEQAEAAAGGQPNADSGAMECDAAVQQALAPHPGLEGVELQSEQPAAAVAAGAAGAGAAAAMLAKQAGASAETVTEKVDGQQQLGQCPSEGFNLPAADVPGHPDCLGGTPALLSFNCALGILPAGALQASTSIEDTTAGGCPAAPSQPSSGMRLARAEEDTMLAAFGPSLLAELGDAADELHMAFTAEGEEFADAEEELAGDALLAEEDDDRGMGSGHLARAPLTQAPSPTWEFDLASPAIQRPPRPGDASIFLGSQMGLMAERPPSMPLPMQQEEQLVWGAAHSPESRRSPLELSQPDRRGSRSQAQAQEPSSEINQQGASMACSETSTQQGSVSGLSADEGHEEIADGKGRRRSSPWLTPLGKLAHTFKRKAEAMEGAAGRPALAATMVKQQQNPPPAHQQQQQQQQQQEQHILSCGAHTSCQLETLEQQQEQQQDVGQVELPPHNLPGGSPPAGRAAGADVRTASPVAPSPSASAWNAPPSPVLDRMELEPSHELPAVDGWEEEEQDAQQQQQGQDSLREDDVQGAAERAQNSSEDKMAWTGTTPPALGIVQEGADEAYAGPLSAAMDNDLLVSAVAVAVGALSPTTAPVPAAAAAPMAAVVAAEKAAEASEAPGDKSPAAEGPTLCDSDPLMCGGGCTALPRTRSGFLALLQELSTLKSDSGRTPEGPRLPALAATCDSLPEEHNEVAEALHASDEPPQHEPISQEPDKPVPPEERAVGLEGAGCAQADGAHPGSPRAEAPQMREQPRLDLEQQPAPVPVNAKEAAGELPVTDLPPCDALQPSSDAILAIHPAQLGEEAVKIPEPADEAASGSAVPQPAVADGLAHAGVPDETQLATAPVLHPPLLAHNDAEPQSGSEEEVLPTLTPPEGFGQESEQHVPPTPGSEPDLILGEADVGPLAVADASVGAAAEPAEEADRALAASLAAAAVQAVLAGAMATASDEQDAMQGPVVAASPVAPAAVPLSAAPEAVYKPAEASAEGSGPTFSFPMLSAGQEASSPTGGMPVARQANVLAARELKPLAAAEHPGSHSMGWSPSSGPSSSPTRIKRFLEEISDKDDLATLLHKSKRASTLPPARPSLPLLAAVLQGVSGRPSQREGDVPGWLEAGPSVSWPQQKEQQQQREQEDEPLLLQQVGQHGQQRSSGSKQGRSLPGRPQRKGQAPVHLTFAAQASAPDSLQCGLACATASIPQPGVAPGADAVDKRPAGGALAMLEHSLAAQGPRADNPVWADTLPDEKPEGRPPVGAALENPAILPSSATDQDQDMACEPDKAAAPPHLQLSSGIQAPPPHSAAEVQAVAQHFSAEVQAAPPQRAMEVQAVQPQRSAEAQAAPMQWCMGVQAVVERPAMRSIEVQTSPVRKLVISRGTQTEWELVSRAVQVTQKTETVGVQAGPPLTSRGAQSPSNGNAAGRVGPSLAAGQGLAGSQSVPLRTRTKEQQQQQQEGGGKVAAAPRCKPAKVAEAGRAAEEAAAHTEPMPKAVLKPKQGAGAQQEGRTLGLAGKAGAAAAPAPAAVPATKPTQARFQGAPNSRSELAARTAAKDGGLSKPTPNLPPTVGPLRTAGNARAGEAPAQYHQASDPVPQHKRQQLQQRPSQPQQQPELQTRQLEAQAQHVHTAVQRPPAKKSATPQVKGVAAPAAKNKRLKTAFGFAAAPQQDQTRDARINLQLQAAKAPNKVQQQRQQQQQQQQRRRTEGNAAAVQRPSLPAAAQPPKKLVKGPAGQAVQAQTASVPPERQPAPAVKKPARQATPAQVPEGQARAAVMAAAEPEQQLRKVLGKRTAAAAQLDRGAAVAATRQGGHLHATMPGARSSTPPLRVVADAAQRARAAVGNKGPVAAAPEDLYYEQDGSPQQQPSIAARGGLPAGASELLARDPMQPSQRRVWQEEEACAQPSPQQQQYQGYRQSPQHAQQRFAQAATSLQPTRACSTPPTRQSADYFDEAAAAAAAELPAWQQGYPAGSSSWQGRAILPSSYSYSDQQAQLGYLRQSSVPWPGPGDQARLPPQRFNQPLEEGAATGYGRATSPWQDSPYGQHQRPQAVGYSHLLQYTHPRPTTRLTAPPVTAAHGAQQQQPQLMDLVMRMIQGRRK